MDKEFSLSESSVSFCIERTLGGATPLSQVIVLKQVFYANRVNLHGKDEISYRPIFEHGSTRSIDLFEAMTRGRGDLEDYIAVKTPA
ncbi:MAG: hypothetical protein HYX47_13030 [Burkholderiales bacterium]|nr:hypothetical protein [Burkholderiales bacterium]